MLLSAVFFLVPENFTDSMSYTKDVNRLYFYLSSYRALVAKRFTRSKIEFIDIYDLKFSGKYESKEILHCNSYK